VRVQVVFGHALQADAVDLAGRVERHLVEEDDLLGCLVADALAAEVDQVGGRSGCAMRSSSSSDRAAIG
jgi:hypothetical protein